MGVGGIYIWIWLVGVVVRRYVHIDFLILLIHTPLVSVLICSSIPSFEMFFILVIINTVTYYRSTMHTLSMSALIPYSAKFSQFSWISFHL